MVGVVFPGWGVRAFISTSGRRYKSGGGGVPEGVYCVDGQQRWAAAVYRDGDGEASGFQ